MKKIVVAISCYNQEKYIGDCMRHLLAQRVEDVRVRILVCDDASTDGTREVIDGVVREMGLPKGWQIEDFPNAKNLGMPENTKRILRILIESGADYGCVLEGDDYWLSPFWLAKHVRAIEENKGTVMSNNYLLFYQKDENIFAVRQYPEVVQESKFISAAMQAEDNYTGNFSSNLYSLEALRKIPRDFLEQPYVDDWFVNLLMVMQGKVVSIKEPLSVYRVHEESVWNGGKKKTSRALVGEHTITRRIEFMNKHYPGKYLAELARFSERWAKIPRVGRLYYAGGEGYSEERSLPIYMSFEGRDRFSGEADLSGLPRGVRKLRYDPEEGFECRIRRLKVFLDNCEVAARAINGEVVDDWVVFGTTDPVFELEVGKNVEGVKKIRMEGEMRVG